MTDRIPPQSPSLEKSLIGSMLINPDMMDRVFENIEPAAIYDHRCNAVFRSMMDLYDDGVQVDIISVSENCTSVDGVDVLLSECTSEYATSPNPDNFIKEINKKFARRYAITCAQHAINLAYNDDSDIGDVANSVEALSIDLERFCTSAGVKRRKRGRLVSVSEISAEVERFFDSGVEKLGLGFDEFPELSKHYRLVKGTLNVIGGIPSHGKTTFTDALVAQSIKEHGWKWAIFSPENKPYYLHIQPLSEKIIGKPFFCDGAMSKEQLRESINLLDKHINFMEPDEENTSHDAIFKLMDDAVKSKVDGILIDPWNKLDISVRKNENKTDAIGRYIKRYQQFSRKNMVYMGLVVHPTKMYKLPNQKKYQVPTLYDCDGSAHWFNGVDIGVTFYRNFDDNYCEIHVQKMKFRNHGKLGKVLMRYNDFNSRLYEISKEQIDFEKEGNKPEKKNKQKKVKEQNLFQEDNEVWQNKL